MTLNTTILPTRVETSNLHTPPIREICHFPSFGGLKALGGRPLNGPQCPNVLSYEMGRLQLCRFSNYPKAPNLA
jgi:hypothetical protein